MLNYYRNKVLRKGLDFEKKQVFRKMSFIKPVSLYLQKMKVLPYCVIILRIDN